VQEPPQPGEIRTRFAVLTEPGAGIAATRRHPHPVRLALAAGSGRRWPGPDVAGPVRTSLAARSGEQAGPDIGSPRRRGGCGGADWHSGRVRVVSLVPSVTETLLAWGVAPVAGTRFCEQPGLPAVGGTKDPDVGAIVALRPDLVVVDAEENRREDHDRLVAAGLDVHVLRVRDLADLDRQLPGLAARVGGRWAPIGPAVPPPIRATAFVPIWRRPWMALGGPTYGSSVLRALGVANAFEADGPYPGCTLDGAAARRPDLVLAPDEPFPFGERHRAELEQVAPTVLLDGRDLLWWGARTPAALERLAGAIGAGTGRAGDLPAERPGDG
jgi:hypothetical protein